MKKVYAILEVSGQGSTEPLKVKATAHTLSHYSVYEKIETFNTAEAAADRGRELVRENPTRTYHVVESVQALFSDAPVKTHSFSGA